MEKIILIHNQQLVEEYKNSLYEFENDCYIKTFPNKDIREDFSDIIRRIPQENIRKSDVIVTFILAILNDENKIIGINVIDYYPKCSCGEIIYLVVDPKYRKLGYGSELAQQTIPTLTKELNIQIQYLFLESSNPVKENHDDFDISRLKNVFSKMEMKRVDIPYVQPPLSNSSDFVDNLILLIFPNNIEQSKNCPSGRILSNYLIAFLQYFYETLPNVNDKVRDEKEKKLCMMINTIKEKTYIDNQQEYFNLSEILDTIPNSSIKYEDITITLHYIINENAEDLNNGRNCAYYHSFQTDLMRYNVQENQPFTTSVISKEFNTEIILPECFEYTSEGNTHIILNEHDNENIIKADISLCYSYQTEEHITFNNRTPQKTHRAVVSLSIAPSEGSFSIIDVLQLVANTNSLQENVQFRDSVKIKMSNDEKMTFEEFIKTRIKIPNINLIPCRNSIIKLVDTNTIDDLNDFNFSNINTQKIAPLCGLIVGIFDYNRMGHDEVKDTIEPVVRTDNTYIILHRGHLVKLTSETNYVDKCLPDPYLLAPSVTLTFNEGFLSSSINYAQKLLNSKRPKNKKLLYLLNIINTNKAYTYISNIFQYASEKRIIEYGNNERNIKTRERTLDLFVEQIENKISENKVRQDFWISCLISIIFGIASIGELYSIVESFTDCTINMAAFWNWIYILSGFIIIIFLLFRIIKR